MKTKILCF